jgi:hypothetical protein
MSTNDTLLTADNPGCFLCLPAILLARRLAYKIRRIQQGKVKATGSTAGESYLIYLVILRGFFKSIHRRAIAHYLIKDMALRLSSGRCWTATAPLMNHIPDHYLDSDRCCHLDNTCVSERKWTGGVQVAVVTVSSSKQ